MLVFGVKQLSANWQFPAYLHRYGSALGPAALAGYKEIMINTAHSLAVRYSPIVKMTRSWGSITDNKSFEVIIDNLINLELLFWAANTTGNATLWVSPPRIVASISCMAIVSERMAITHIEHGPPGCMLVASGMKHAGARVRDYFPRAASNRGNVVDSITSHLRSFFSLPPTHASSTCPACLRFSSITLVYSPPPLSLISLPRPRYSYEIAFNTADNMGKHWIRPDGSTFHLVVFDPETGAVISRSGTPQGYAVNSTWARGQAWGVYVHHRIHPPLLHRLPFPCP